MANAAPGVGSLPPWCRHASGQQNHLLVVLAGPRPMDRLAEGRLLSAMFGRRKNSCLTHPKRMLIRHFLDVGAHSTTTCTSTFDVGIRLLRYVGVSYVDEKNGIISTETAYRRRFGMGVGFKGDPFGVGLSASMKTDQSDAWNGPQRIAIRPCVMRKYLVQTCLSII